MDEPATFASQGMVVKYLLHLQKQGYRPETITSHSKILRFLSKHCNLHYVDSVKEFVANREVSTGRKENISDVYGGFARFHSISFTEQRYNRIDKLPFVPLEHEILAIVDASRNLRHAALLRMLYESGCRVGEASQLRFKDCDFEKRTVRIIPEKGSKPRELRISEKLCAIMKEVYGKYVKNPLPDPRTARKYLEGTRSILAKSHNNSRFLNIHLHTFRHFRATMLYHQTKDILYVKEMLGHRSLFNTLRYTQLVDWKDSEQFVCKVARTLAEASCLIETGFDYVTELDGVKLFRKRK